MPQIRDLLKRKGHRVHVVGPEETVTSCAYLMTQNGVGSLLVARDRQPVGIVTWHDIIALVGRRANGLDELPVRDVMSTPLETTTEDAELDDVKGKMVERRIRHMPVLRGEDVVGLVTLVDVLHLHLDEASAWNEQLQTYIYGP